jgi:hypothetical protein
LHAANLGLALAEHVNSNPSLHQTPRISCGKRTVNNHLLNKNAASIKETAAKHKSRAMALVSNENLRKHCTGCLPLRSNLKTGDMQAFDDNMSKLGHVGNLSFHSRGSRQRRLVCGLLDL